MDMFKSFSETIGNTRIIELVEPALRRARILVKLEGDNPTGSVKDRACLAMFRRMVRDPDWHRSKTVLDATSGNMGCSIAYFGRALGMPVRIVASSKLTVEKRFFMEYFGARVETMGSFTIEGNEYCRKVATSDPERWYFLDQLHNWENPSAHFSGTGPEIISQVPGVRVVIGSIGTGGTLLGVGRHLKQIDDRIKIIAVEAASGTRLPGTAALADGDYRTPFISAGFDDQVFDMSLRVSEREAAAMARNLPASGLFGGLQTGGVIAAAVHAVREYGLRGDIVVLSGDSGWKNVEVLRRSMAG